MYFREQINLGISLKTVSRTTRSTPAAPHEQDAAVAAANLYERLTSGYYRDLSGRRHKIDGDTSKLFYAEGISPVQKRLLADVRFRTRMLSGTKEIRTKIGHIGFWASVVYGNGIFITISPSERHNYLAIRLSRYRSDDPYVQANPASQNDAAEAIVEDNRVKGERKWIGQDSPSLEPAEDDVFDFDIPGYDIRRLILARDPLCAANAFNIYIRCVLATALGVRMCPDCPHCAESQHPCTDALGSNAEIMGGFAGRGDAIFGAVECQKLTGSLHLHLWFFGQRLHQFHSLLEIADLLKKLLGPCRRSQRLHQQDLLHILPRLEGA